MGCTPLYTSPEVLLRHLHMPASDAWCIGASFYEVITLKTFLPCDAKAAELPGILEAFNPEEEMPAEGNGNIARENFQTLRICCEGLSAQSPEAHAAAQELEEILKELLRPDPLQRPLAAECAGRPAIMTRIRTVLRGTDALAEDIQSQEDHFDEFERILAESELAADLEPPGLEVATLEQVR